MFFKDADLADFDRAYEYIEQLWDYNTYDKAQVLEVYRRVIEHEDAFAFFISDEDGNYHGFCHGDYFDTFWMSGRTCYISSLITNPEDRGKGYGIQLVDHAKELAIRKQCKAMILESGMPRVRAHAFYEKYGFEKSCYGFEYLL